MAELLNGTVSPNQSVSIRLLLAGGSGGLKQATQSQAYQGIYLQYNTLINQHYFNSVSRQSENVLLNHNKRDIGD